MGRRVAKPDECQNQRRSIYSLEGCRFRWLWALEVLLQKRRNKKSAIRFLIRLLGNYLVPRVIVTDKLRSYIKPIRHMCPQTDHRFHKGLNNRVENAHQPTRRKEKILIKFKSPQRVQKTLSLMGKVRNIFAVDVGRYTKNARKISKKCYSRICTIGYLWKSLPC